MENELAKTALKVLLMFLGGALGTLFIFLLKDYFQSKWKKTDTLESSIQNLASEMAKNTKAIENNDRQIEVLNNTIKVLYKLEVDFGRIGSKLRRVARAVEKFTGAPIPPEEPEL